ncbi:MAG: APC family permease [Desulfomonile tiedjei]|nr:APC family permease [Desulfomonile tiedjei]
MMLQGSNSGSGSARSSAGQIGLFAAMSIGIGGMIGAGIFSILGVVAEAAGTAMWLSFMIGGVVALLSTYSYSKLGVRYPSAGGAVEFLVKGFGDGVLSGGINLYMWVGYVIALALYAQGFAGYAMTFFPPHLPPWISKGFGVGIVLIFTAVNVVGARVVGGSETFIVTVKLIILGVFAVAGLYFIHPGYLTPASWPSSSGILFGAGVLFIGYEGFGLVANAAEDMDDPRKMLPKALYLSVIAVILIYVAVSVAVIGNLDVKAILAAKDYALAEAAKPFLGDFGFRLIAIGALFSTASAINATLFGAANVSYMIARDGELPRVFSWKLRQDATGGLFITAGLVIVFILFFDLSGIAMMGSGAFLLIYACVHAAHLRVLAETGGNKWIVTLSLVSCLAMFAVLSVYIYENSRPALITMIALVPICLAAEWAYRTMTGRAIKTRA